MPFAPPLQQIDRTHVLFRGRKLTYFGGCDYFRLSSHPEVLLSFHESAEEFGVNVAASRFTTGNHVLFQKLESELARFFGTEQALLVSNGYATNLALAQGLAGRFTHAFIDERCHGSPMDAAVLLQCRVKTFRHRDTQDLQQQLKACGKSAMPVVLTDGMFSHDGSLAPLRKYLDLLPRRGTLFVDDAHGAGTLGRTGKGTPELCGVRDSRIVQTISLSKAFGVYGGAIVGRRAILREVQERSRILKGNTPLPLPLANAARTSIKLLTTDRSLRARLRANISRVKKDLRSAGMHVADNDSPLMAIVPPSAKHANRLQRSLLRASIYPPLIRYGNERGPGYFRFAISSEHTAGQLDALVRALTNSSQ